MSKHFSPLGTHVSTYLSLVKILKKKVRTHCVQVRAAVFSNVAETAWKGKHLRMSRKMRTDSNWVIEFLAWLMLHLISFRIEY